MIMAKRIYFETTETTVKNKKGFIEIDTDFTQVYDCFNKVCVHMKSITAVKLLFWLLAHEANKSNGIRSGNEIYLKFIKYLQDEGAEIVTERTFQNCFDELCNIKALTKISRGQYYFNPHIFWRDEKGERVNFITDEAKEKRHISYNPIPQISKNKETPRLSNKNKLT
jgi:hypothetical protein